VHSLGKGLKAFNAPNVQAALSANAIKFSEKQQPNIHNSFQPIGKLTY